MQWTFDNFPVEMNDLTPRVRMKAIEIANKLMQEGKLSEKEAIKQAIKKAEEWFINLEG